MRERRKQMSSKRLYLDIHAIQVLPPSCVNRDDTNTPKTCVYGGKTRARVSSQSWKRAMRMFFKEQAPELAGVRTKKIKSETAKRLVEMYGFSESDADEAAAGAAKTLEIVSSKDEAKETIAFFSNAQMDAFAAVIAENKEIALKKSNDKEYKKALGEAIKNQPSADMLLFGRMFAGNPSLDYDAASQVAHAISVNEARTEYDYFTAVDDIPDVDHSGSAYLDTKRYTDPILYRYANVNLSDNSELIRFDCDHVLEIVKEFMRAFILSMPSGSQNAYANTTLPDYIMITLREDRPVSFAPAFIEVVKGENYMQESRKKLKDYANWVSNNYQAPVVMVELGERSFTEMLNLVSEEIERRL